MLPNKGCPRQTKNSAKRREKKKEPSSHSFTQQHIYSTTYILFHWQKCAVYMLPERTGALFLLSRLLALSSAHNHEPTTHMCTLQQLRFSYLKHGVQNKSGGCMLSFRPAKCKLHCKSALKLLVECTISLLRVTLPNNLLLLLEVCAWNASCTVHM